MGDRVTRLLFIGIPSFAAISVGFPMLAFFSRSGPPLERVDWVGGIIFTALAWAGFAMTVRSALRVWRGGSSLMHFIAWFSPVLLLGGIVAGAWAAFSIHRSHVESSETWATTTWCDRPTFVGHSTVEACEQATLECLHLAWEGATLEAGLADRLLATITTRRQQAEKEATRRSKTDGYYDGGEVRVLDRLRESMKVEASRPRDTEVRQAALACLVTRGS